MIRSFCVFVVALVCAVPLRAPASDDPLAGLDAAIESAREQWHAPGLAVAIVKDDQVVYLRGFGTKHLGRNDPVDAHTAFTLASTTKAFTAMALGLLLRPIGCTVYAMPPYVLDAEAVHCLAQGALAALESTLAEEAQSL